jgi:hypothetical protein
LQRKAFPLFTRAFDAFFGSKNDMYFSKNYVKRAKK